jgi:aryl-alcohol dehydrogenase-like predicted oxidoreductase
MRYTRLGKTNLDVSVLALGAWAFGGDCVAPPSFTCSSPQRKGWER